MQSKKSKKYSDHLGDDLERKKILFDNTEVVDTVSTDEIVSAEMTTEQDEMEKLFNIHAFCLNALEDIREFVEYQTIPIAENINIEYIDLLIRKLSSSS